MRQRKAKDLDRRIAECEEFLIREPKPECWDACFPGRAEAGSSAAAGQCDLNRPAAGQCDPRRPLYLEIGCGKGDFIIARALDDPGSDYIGALTKPGSFTDMQFDSVGGFSFSPAPGAGEYDLQFTAAYHLTTEEQEADTAPAVQVQLHFRRNAEMKMILTAANLNFQGTGLGTQKETEAEA